MKGNLDQRAEMIKELIEGIETTKQLRNQIIRPTNQGSSSRNDVDQALINHSLIDKMLSTFNKTISLAKLMGFHHHQLPQQPSFNIDAAATAANNNNNNNNINQYKSDSPRSLALSSPRSENTHHVSKKRKTMSRCIKIVKVSSSDKISGLEGPLDDGFSWRKYGQKDILRAKFPRGYYRCTHRPTQGCEAKKHVQQSDEDPSIYKITYLSEHTCSKGAHLPKTQTRPDPAQIKTEPQPQSQKYQQAQSPQKEVYLGLGPDGDLQIEPDHETENKAQMFRSFSFTFASVLEDAPIDDYILRYTTTFGSPTTSGSTNFPVSGAGLHVQTSGSDFHEAMSGPNSVTNSPNFEFPHDELLDIDPNFPFEFNFDYNY